MIYLRWGADILELAKSIKKMSAPYSYLLTQIFYAILFMEK